MLARRDARSLAREDNGHVDRVSGRSGWYADALRRLAAAPHAPAIGGIALGLLAAVQAIAQSPGGGDFSQGVGLVLLALFSTLPLGLLWSYPAGAAVAVGAACVLSLAAFHTLTVAGLIAQLIAAYRLGRSGGQLLAAVLALPYLVLALLPPTGTADRILTVLLAALSPAAAWAGAARRARSEAADHSAAREVIAGSLLEHTARGERARVSRELHDVVAHHISMIAVQAETARLTTPGMPAAGAQRLSAIGDTARAECTPLHRGRTTMVWQTKITRGDGRLAAIVTQTQLVLAGKKSPQ